MWVYNVWQSSLFYFGLKCHTFIGLNMTLDCRVNLYVRLVRINIRQYDLLISMFHNIEYNKWCREDFYNYSKVENEILKKSTF